jgi:small subunit ribosomal protein S21
LAEVRVQEGEPLENALRRFKRKVQQEDIIKEVKRHSYYLKPGEKRRVKKVGDTRQPRQARGGRLRFFFGFVALHSRYVVVLFKSSASPGRQMNCR